MANLYEILGVAENASNDEIKSAYRKLAMKYHPDKNQGDKAAEDKFKEVTGAYETLIDQQKRKEYDFQRTNQFHNNRQHFHMNFGQGNIDDIIQQMFNQAGFNFRRGPEKNQDVSFNMKISLDDAFLGKQVPLQINTPSGRRVELGINIPSGVESGMRIRYQGQGDQRNTNLPPGDLYIQIEIAEHPLYTRSGSTLETKLTVDAIDLILGVKQQIKCIDQSVIELIIPPGTQHGIKLRVPHKGMPQQPNSKERGDLLVQINALIPSIADKQLEQMLVNVQKIRGLDNR
jgi:curved DNA-binding protein